MWLGTLHLFPELSKNADKEVMFSLYVKAIGNYRDGKYNNGDWTVIELERGKDDHTRWYEIIVCSALLETGNMRITIATIYPDDIYFREEYFDAIHPDDKLVS